MSEEKEKYGVVDYPKDFPLSINHKKRLEIIHSKAFFTF